MKCHQVVLIFLVSWVNLVTLMKFLRKQFKNLGGGLSSTATALFNLMGPDLQQKITFVSQLSVDELRVLEVNRSLPGVHEILRLRSNHDTLKML